MPPDLTAEERATYEWQMWTPDFGEAGQQKLKQASVLISRVGGVGGAVAYALAAAGVGRLVLAHAGNIKHSDLNRQMLMTHAGLGASRVESAARRLRELNPHIEIEAVPENIDESNAARLVGSVDLAIGCAPRFEERLLMNREAVRQQRPLIDCAMYEFAAQLTTLKPGATPCLACLYPSPPVAWKRQFPVFGAVSSAIGSLAAVEAIKLLAGIGELLLGRMLIADLGSMHFRVANITRRADCAVCADVSGGAA